MTDTDRKHAIIIGAGPAGLTAAYELATRTGITPIVLEQSQEMGGIARTINYKGNRIDIGGHRFFSKSDRVMDWWFDVLPLQSLSNATQTITYQASARQVQGGADGPDPELEDRVLLVRERQSRILFSGKLFAYPIKLNVDTLLKLGPIKAARIAISYAKSLAFPRREERHLEDFLINRFGEELYLTFFKAYTEKVWGVPCEEISAEWGAQRIKGLSIAKTIAHYVRGLLKKDTDVRQKTTETSLIEQFLYPKFGPGQMWEEVSARIARRGGQVITGERAHRLELDGDRVRAVWSMRRDGSETRYPADYVFSTMAIKDLVKAFDGDVPADVVAVNDGLDYRDFITVGVLLKRLRVRDGSNRDGMIADNWIYVQEPHVMVGRIQIFNNWSPYMVKDPNTVWLGLEYFCFDRDPIWGFPDQQIVDLAVRELQQIGFAEPEDVLDATVIRVPKTYPGYFGSYPRFDTVRGFLDGIENLFCVGRNGMHRYNNQDHSMLTAMVAVDNIIAGVSSRENIWSVNTEEDYHEER